MLHRHPQREIDSDLHTWILRPIVGYLLGHRCRLCSVGQKHKRWPAVIAATNKETGVQAQHQVRRQGADWRSEYVAHTPACGRVVGDHHRYRGGGCALRRPQLKISSKRISARHRSSVHHLTHRGVSSSTIESPSDRRFRFTA